MNILVTNDDSLDSPLFSFMIREARKLGNITVVVPAEEQSWKGKSMSKTSPPRLSRLKIDGQNSFAVTGTPADCANIGIYHLCEKRPDLILSGINIGANTGVSFALSSGTIGACWEANIAGIPAIALSQDFDWDTFSYWGQRREFQPNILTRLDQQLSEWLPMVFNHILNDKSGITAPITWNVNFPFVPAVSPQIKNAYLGHSFYQSCFARNGDNFTHDLASFDSDSNSESDIAIVKSGHISMTPLDIRKIGAISS